MKILNKIIELYMYLAKYSHKREQLDTLPTLSRKVHGSG